MHSLECTRSLERELELFFLLEVMTRRTDEFEV